MALFSRANRATLVRFELSILTFLQNTLKYNNFAIYVNLNKWI
jgi:hypothetical protein